MAFCWIYVRKYQSQRESEVVSTITAIFSLAIALITSALLPVDIFLVSYMKNQNGTFKVIICPFMFLAIKYLIKCVAVQCVLCFIVVTGNKREWKWTQAEDVTAHVEQTSH